MKYKNETNYYNPNNSLYSKSNSYQQKSDGYNNVIYPVEDSCNINSAPNQDVEIQNLPCNNNNSGCSNHQHNNNDDDLCGGRFCNILPSEKCCKGMSCQVDSSKLECICTYLDVIYSECNLQGTPIIIPITVANSSTYTVTEDYKHCSSKCCSSCPVTISSAYTIERMKATVSTINLISIPSTSQILIDSVPVLSIMPTSNNSLSATINPSVESEDCNDNSCGTKASVLLNTLGSWAFLVKFELCGKVTTAEGNCKFSINMDSLTTIPITTASTSTFVCPELCIPDLDENIRTYLNIKFDATAQLINPIVTMTAAGLQLNTTVLLNPKARVETIKNCKVCLNGNLFNNN